MHVVVGSGVRILYSSISSMSRMVSANTIKAKYDGMGVGENYHDLKENSRSTV